MKALKSGTQIKESFVSSNLGTDEERGLVKWNDQFKSEDCENSEATEDTYDLPLGMGIIKRYSILPWQ